MSDVPPTLDNAIQSPNDDVTDEISQEYGDVTQKEDEELKRLRNKELKVKINTLKENRKVRRSLIRSLTCLSFVWLCFTAVIVLCLGVGSCFGSAFRLSDAVSIAFITTSLATVCGLWVIGLKYFFSPS